MDCKRYLDEIDVPNPWGDFVPTMQRCEDRLVMSALPLLDIIHHQIDDLDSFRAPETAAGIPSSSQMGPFESVNQSIASSENAGTDGVTPQASTAHQQTGWTDVQRLFGLQGSGQTVAVIDSGVAWDHVGLGGGFGPGYRVVGGWDFAESDSNPYDDRPAGFHGTHVAGIIGAEDTTRSGVASDVDIVALRVFDDAGKGQLAWVENALQWVHQNKNTFEFPITTVNLSLGSTWNANTVPQWATLEDEFQALRNDGIVVVASAGNSFQQYNAPGLSYPAASPLVIPVASVDADGSLSSFSQRNDRVLAAPGRSILSTVPDHFLSSDGIVNDWAVVSGTSMAAPYVAGASVLVREAMQLAGWSSITPAGIYNWMMDTADSIYDSATNATYDRLNLARAITNLLPTDQVGNDWNNASNVNLQSQSVTDGWLNTLGDRDVYRFTATSNGTMSFNVESQHLSDSALTLWANGQSSTLSTSGQGSFAVVAGQSYAIGISDTDQIGSFQLKSNFTPTAEPSNPSDGGTSGGSSMAQNGIIRTGSNLQITGSDNSDRYNVDLSQGIKIEVNGSTYSFAAGVISGISVDLKGGDDLIRIVGSSASEKMDMASGNVTLESSTLKMTVANTEQVEFKGGGGYDRAYLVGTDGDDTLTAKPRSGELLGAGYRLVVSDVERIYVDASQAGQDVAYFYDSAGDDRLSVRPQFSSMSGDGFFNYASGIERVYAYSNAGGIDSATLYDSSFADTFNTSGDVASIVGPTFFSYTRYFENVEAISASGGRDVASVYATDGNSILVGSDFSGYQDSQWARIARGFADSRTFLNNQILSTRSFAIESISMESYAVDGSIAEVTSPNDASLDSQSRSEIASSFSSDSPVQMITSKLHIDVAVVPKHTMFDLEQAFYVNSAVYADVGTLPHPFDSDSKQTEDLSRGDWDSKQEFVRLNDEDQNQIYESLLVDIDDEQRWLDAIFAEHGAQYERVL